MRPGGFIGPRARLLQRLFDFARAPLYVANGVDTERFAPAAAKDRERQELRERFGWSAGSKGAASSFGRFVEKKGLPLLPRTSRRRALTTVCLRRSLGTRAQDPSSVGAGERACDREAAAGRRSSIAPGPPIRWCCRRSAKDSAGRSGSDGVRPAGPHSAGDLRGAGRPRSDRHREEPDATSGTGRSTGWTHSRPARGGRGLRRGAGAETTTTAYAALLESCGKPLSPVLRGEGLG